MDIVDIENARNVAESLSRNDAHAPELLEMLARWELEERAGLLAFAPGARELIAPFMPAT